MRANLQREIAAAAIGGGSGQEPVHALITRGLSVLRDARRLLRDAGLSAALAALRDAKAGRAYVRVALPRGAHARLALQPPDFGRINGGPRPLVTVYPARGNPRASFDVPQAALDLTRLCGTDVEAATRVLLGLERARRRCYELSEEGTRWL